MPSIFTRILDGELPGHKVWQDELCFSIMTIQPIREGHLLVIPREEINHWDEVPEAVAAHLMKVSQIIARAMKQVIDCRRIGVSIIGLEVPHTHIHLIPIDSMADMDFANSGTTEAGQLEAVAEKIRAALKQAGYAGADLP
ncbi:MAG: HIT family protein [Pseudohongiellaceae bacterium]